MNKLWIAGLGLWFLLADLAPPVAVGQETKDPVYMGKALSECIRELKDKNKAVRLEAARAVGRFRPEETGAAVPVLIQVLKDEDPLVRSAAAFALFRMGQL